MKNNADAVAEIKMAFIPLNVSGNELYIVGAVPVVGRTFYTLHLIEENSLKYGNKKCLVYFVGYSKQKIIRDSSFGKLLDSSENVNMQRVNFRRGKQIIRDIKHEVSKNKPDYIVVDGFEKLFGHEEKEDLPKEVDTTLSELRTFCDKKNIPIILTTRILLSAEKTTTARPLLCDFGSKVLEINAKHVLSLSSPFYHIDDYNIEGEDMRNTMVLYKLKTEALSLVSEPTQFIIDKGTGQFYSKK